MLRLIQAEFLKLRRKKFIVLMLLSALFMPLLAVFYFRSADKTVIEPLQFYKWTTFSYTIKSLRLIPISEAKMTIAKLLITFAFSVLFYLLLFGITFLVEVILHFRGLSIKMILSFFKIYLLDGIGIFFAIAPVIAVVSRIKKGYWLALIFTVIYSFAGLFTSISDVLSACYPITATFNISGYYSATFGEIIISLMSLFFCGLFSVLILISKKTIKNK